MKISHTSASEEIWKSITNSVAYEELEFTFFPS